MKRIFALVLSLVMLLSLLVGCGSNKDTPPSQAIGSQTGNGSQEPMNPGEGTPGAQTTPIDPIQPGGAQNSAGSSIINSNTLTVYAPNLDGVSTAECLAIFTLNETETSQMVADVHNGKAMLDDLEALLTGNNYMVNNLGGVFRAFHGDETFSLEGDGTSGLRASFSYSMRDSSDVEAVSEKASAFLGVVISPEDFRAIGKESESWMGENGSGDKYYAIMENAEHTLELYMAFGTADIYVKVTRTFL